MILFPGRHLMGVLECHQLTPLNKMVKLKTHQLWCQYDGCTHGVNSNGSGRENYSSHQTIYVLTLIGKWTYIYLLTLNKKQAMRVSRCMFCAKKKSAKPTSTHTYWEKAIRVSRCRFSGINMFGGFHVLAGSSIKLRTEIKGTVVWPSVGMFGGSMSLDYFGRFLNQIRTGKKGTVVWPSVTMFGGFHELGLFWRVCRYVFSRVPWSNYKLRPEKRYSHLAISWNVYYVLWLITP